MKTIRVAVAERRLAAELERSASISVTGSVRGMVKLYGWKAENCWRIGSYIHHFWPADADRIRSLNL